VSGPAPSAQRCGSTWKDSGGPGFNAISIGLENSVWGNLADTAASAPGLYRFSSQRQWGLAVKPPAGVTLQSFTVVEPYDIWAVGNNSKLHHWNGQVWDDVMPRECGASSHRSASPNSRRVLDHPLSWMVAIS
jgi:hypothetical protein